MSLQNLLEHKLLYLEKRITKAKQAVSFLENLILVLKRKTKIEMTKQFLIRKELELNRTKLMVKEYSNELCIYFKHKDIIISNERRIKIALSLLEETEDKITNVIATIQSLIIYLGIM